LRGEASALPREQDLGAFPGEPRPAPVGIGPRSEGGFGIGVQLDVSLPGVPREEAQALVEKAHQVCPYSNATRNNVPVRVNVV
jgi:organic hydroperoxide reductase OsmC/OhrA